MHHLLNIAHFCGNILMNSQSGKRKENQHGTEFFCTVRFRKSNIVLPQDSIEREKLYNWQ